MWTTDAPREPGDYWFCPRYKNRVTIREVREDHNGELLVTSMSPGDWGPDVRYLAISQEGWWMKVETPTMPEGKWSK